MSFEGLLNHSCDIYHYSQTSKSKGFGITIQEDDYSSVPDIESVSCHFHGEKIEAVQNEPNQDIVASRKVDFPLGTDIRLNDKVVFNGIRYYANRPPNNVRNHHITVVLTRKGKYAHGTS